MFMQPPSDLQVIKFQLDVNRRSSKQDTDFHTFPLCESESMIHCFSTYLCIVLVNGTSCAASVFTKPMLACFPCHVLCKSTACGHSLLT